LSEVRKHGSDSSNSKITEKDVIEIRKRYEEGEKSPRIAYDYNITPRNTRKAVFWLDKISLL